MIPIKLVRSFLSIFLSIIDISTLVTTSVCNCNDILAETTKVLFSKQPVHSTQERFFKMYLQTPQNIQTLTQTALSFLLDFTKPCRLLSTTHLSLKVTKKQHISNQIPFFGKDTEDTAGHIGHIDEDHPVPMKSEAQCVQKRNITSVPEGLEHTHKTLHLTGVTFGTAKGK